MLAVITLYYCPSQGHYSFAFVVNFEKVLSFDRYSYFAHFFIIITISIIYHFIFCYYFFIILKIGIVVIISVFFLTLVYFVCSVTWWCACSMSVILYDLFFMPICCFCHWLWANISCIVVSLIHFRFENFMDFDTDRFFFVQLWSQWSCTCSLY